MIAGPYHFACRRAENTGTDEAIHFIEGMDQQGCMMPMYDMEATSLGGTISQLLFQPSLRIMGIHPSMYINGRLFKYNASGIGFAAKSACTTKCQHAEHGKPSVSNVVGCALSDNSSSTTITAIPGSNRQS